jgi:hypothetical protein
MPIRTNEAWQGLAAFAAAVALALLERRKR